VIAADDLARRLVRILDALDAVEPPEYTQPLRSPLALQVLSRPLVAEIKDLSNSHYLDVIWANSVRGAFEDAFFDAFAPAFDEALGPSCSAQPVEPAPGADSLLILLSGRAPSRAAQGFAPERRIELVGKTPALSNHARLAHEAYARSIWAQVPQNLLDGFQPLALHNPRY